MQHRIGLWSHYPSPSLTLGEERCGVSAGMLASARGKPRGWGVRGRADSVAQAENRGHERILMGTQNSGVQGRVVVITGGGTGIGAAVAERYASEGADVVLVGRRPGPIEEVAAAVGGTAIVADASDGESARAAVAQVIEKFGRLDVLVANAGGHGFNAVGDTDDATWESAIKVNLTTAFVMARESLPALIESRGQIVVISSLAGHFAGPNVAGYTATKHALLGLTRSMARDYGKQGVRVNAVCPGWTRTPMADAEMDEFMTHVPEISSREEAYGRVTRDVPLKRVGEPAEIASVVRFLGSDESSYMTGAVLLVDGGAHVVDLPTISFEHAGM